MSGLRSPLLKTSPDKAQEGPELISICRVTERLHSPTAGRGSRRFFAAPVASLSRQRVWLHPPPWPPPAARRKGLAQLSHQLLELVSQSCDDGPKPVEEPWTLDVWLPQQPDIILQVHCRLELAWEHCRQLVPAIAWPSLGVRTWRYRVARPVCRAAGCTPGYLPRQSAPCRHLRRQLRMGQAAPGSGDRFESFDIRPASASGAERVGLALATARLASTITAVHCRPLIISLSTCSHTHPWLLLVPRRAGRISLLKDGKNSREAQRS